MKATEQFLFSGCIDYYAVQGVLIFEQYIPVVTVIVLCSVDQNLDAQ